MLVKSKDGQKNYVNENNPGQIGNAILRIYSEEGTEEQEQLASLLKAFTIAILESSKNPMTALLNMLHPGIPTPEEVYEISISKGVSEEDATSLSTMYGSNEVSEEDFATEADRLSKKYNLGDVSEFLPKEEANIAGEFDEPVSTGNAEDTDEREL